MTIILWIKRWLWQIVSLLTVSKILPRTGLENRGLAYRETCGPAFFLKKFFSLRQYSFSLHFPINCYAPRSKADKNSISPKIPYLCTKFINIRPLLAWTNAFPKAFPSRRGCLKKTKKQKAICKYYACLLLFDRCLLQKTLAADDYGTTLNNAI